MRVYRTIAVTAAAVLAFAACGDDDDDTATDDAPAEVTTTVADDGTSDTTAPAADDEGGQDVAATIGVGETELGSTLVDADGLTLYVFDTDTEPLASTCGEGCTDIWPPLTVDGDPVIPENVDASLFETFTRDDGSTQLAIAGRPLYRFASDAAPGDVGGHGVGNVWWAVGPDGEALGDD